MIGKILTFYMYSGAIFKEFIIDNLKLKKTDEWMKLKIL